jgi:hypothetical protein
MKQRVLSESLVIQSPSGNISSPAKFYMVSVPDRSDLCRSWSGTKSEQ